MIVTAGAESATQMLRQLRVGYDQLQAEHAALAGGSADRDAAADSAERRRAEAEARAALDAEAAAARHA